FVHRFFGLFPGRTGGHATGKVRRIRGVVLPGFFDDDEESMYVHFFSPACLRMLFIVAGARSSLGLPEIVTRPLFVGCLNWRCLPPPSSVKSAAAQRGGNMGGECP